MFPFSLRLYWVLVILPMPSLHFFGSRVFFACRRLLAPRLLNFHFLPELLFRSGYSSLLGFLFVYPSIHFNLLSFCQPMHTFLIHAYRFLLSPCYRPTY
ncbi:hypothetical protein FA13DRAFT_283056 [Coprinellus micaceus]|uniref:Uncharacterized protein n=1 Tax=Coprinellus micaceus TaxID=71717 RepID=A0A4Y7TDN1_COPMI|nr:hypothetical protein FA13DRAFT_283056 [Coprinellus micaceus]